MSALRRYLISVAVLVLLGVAAVCGYGLAHGWGGGQDLGRGLVITGSVVAGLGLLTLLGNSRAATDPQYVYMQAVMRQNLTGEARRDRYEFLSRYSVFFVLATTGLLVSLLGLIVEELWR